LTLRRSEPYIAASSKADTASLNKFPMRVAGPKLSEIRQLCEK
jgi:hypothetical protein